MAWAPSVEFVLAEYVVLFPLEAREVVRVELYEEEDTVVVIRVFATVELSRVVVFSVSVATVSLERCAVVVVELLRLVAYDEELEAAALVLVLVLVLLEMVLPWTKRSNSSTASLYLP